MTARSRTHTKTFDRLMSPGATKDEIRCDYACAPYDRAALDADRKWGVNRLAGLVAPATAEKFGRALAHLNDCLQREAPEEAAAAAHNAMRGLAAMDAEATAAGHQPARPDIWQVEYLGRTFAFIREAEQWPAAQAAVPGATIYTLQEAARALSDLAPDMVATIKAHFPGAQIGGVRKPTPTEEAIEDFIPF